MNIESFLSYLKNPEEISKEDIPALEDFVQKNPYCQIGRVILAKIAHDENNPDKTLKLNQAALYTANRAVLKEIIEKGWGVLPAYSDQQPLQAVESKATEQENMNELSANETLQDEPAPQAEPELSVEGEVVTGDENIQQEIALEEPRQTMDSTDGETYPDVANQIIEAIEENRKLRDQLQRTDRDKTGKNSGNTRNNKPEAEIIPTPGEENEDEQELRKKEQLEIIDNFISLENTLVRRKLRIPEGPTAPQEDLALKSSSLNDDLISENLALIMKKQGKIDKAIDIYKKLIWKFPQKKTYFASLIEELKKK